MGDIASSEADAARCNEWGRSGSSPSIPNASLPRIPNFERSCMPPRAKCSALRTAKQNGSSMTMSAPFMIAAFARDHLLRIAELPRSVKLPLISMITGAFPVSSLAFFI